MRALVTGAAGFIGSHLAEALVRSGHHVTAVDRRPLTDVSFPALLLDDPQFTYAQMDIGDDGMPGLLKDIQWVFHLAGATGVRSSWGQAFTEYVACNVLATHRLLELCTAAGVPRMIVASSSSVYGELNGPATRETDPTIPLSPYGVSKLAAEQLALAYAGRVQAATSVVVLRYFTVYGPRQRPDMAMSRMFNAVLSGEPMRLYGDGSQRRSFTFIGDVVEATIRSAELKTQAEVLNIGSGDCTTLAEVADLIGQITGQPVPIARRDRHPGDVTATDADITKARRLLGYQPSTGLLEGLQRQWEWMLADHDRSAAPLVAGGAG
jgi:nucleoside-diphosphate-sugar epimerase